jgi:signal transduction histidine kinase
MTIVRLRIIGLAVWASALAIGLFAVPLGVAVFKYAMQTERRDLERVADSVAIAVAGDVLDEQVEELDEPKAIDVSVYDEDGNLLHGVPPEGGRPQLARALVGAVGAGDQEGHLVVAVPVTHDDEVIGAVEVRGPRSTVLWQVALVWAGMAILGVLAMAAAWLVGLRQARRLALPLEDLAVAARELGDGDFSIRCQPGGIQEIDSVGAALNSTAARLDALLSRERAFSADASHQLRTPLAGLRLRLEAALERPDQDLRPAIIASLADADRLEATISELLALARNEQAASTCPIDLAALFDDLAPAWRGLLALQGRDLDVRTDPGAPMPIASTAATGQVLSVLIDNATRHGAGTVSVSVRDASGAVAIDVADQGRGLQEPDALLFARRADQRDGHGVGLALARRLAEAEGGRLTLARPSPPTFTLFLPAVSAAEGTAGTSGPSLAANGGDRS